MPRALAWAVLLRSSLPPVGCTTPSPFTHETKGGSKTCLEWEGKVFGEDVGGTTILTRDDAELIESVQLYHRPLHILVRFSAELGRRLQGKLDAALFDIP